MVSTCPCKGCVPPKRHVGCHATCQLYIDWKKEYDVNAEKIRNNKNMERLGRPTKPVRRRRTK